MTLFDPESAKRIEAAYETADAVRRRGAVAAALALRPGERVIDVGTGPGFLASEMADAVGPDGRVLAVDNSPAMLELATRRCGTRPQATVAPGDAVVLPGRDAEFDALASVQVYEYVVDVDAALAEAVRVLRPGGRAAIVATDWHTLAWRSGDPERMAAVLSAFAAHCAHQHLPRTLAPRLRAAGLRVADVRALPILNLSFDSTAFSRHLADLIAGFATGRDGLTAQDVAGWLRDLERIDAEGAYFFSLGQFLFVATKPE